MMEINFFTFSPTTLTSFITSSQSLFDRIVELCENVMFLLHKHKSLSTYKYSAGDLLFSNKGDGPTGSTLHICSAAVVLFFEGNCL